jgi:hypothetical protein
MIGNFDVCGGDGAVREPHMPLANECVYERTGSRGPHVEAERRLRVEHQRSDQADTIIPANRARRFHDGVDAGARVERTRDVDPVVPECLEDPGVPGKVALVAAIHPWPTRDCRMETMGSIASSLISSMLAMTTAKSSVSVSAITAATKSGPFDASTGHATLRGSGPVLHHCRF